MTLTLDELFAHSRKSSFRILFRRSPSTTCNLVHEAPRGPRAAIDHGVNHDNRETQWLEGKGSLHGWSTIKGEATTVPPHQAQAPVTRAKINN